MGRPGRPRKVSAKDQEEIATHNFRTLLSHGLLKQDLSYEKKSVFKPKRLRRNEKQKRVQKRDVTLWTKRLILSLRRCIAHQLWDDAAKLLHALTFEPNRTSEVVWMAGFQIFCNHPKSNVGLLNEFSYAMRKMDKVFYPVIALENIMVYLARGDFINAENCLQLAEKPKHGPGPKLNEKRQHILLTLQGYRAMFHYADWKAVQDEMISSVETKDADSNENRKIERDDLAKKAIELFENLFTNPGVWDIFVSKYIDLMEYYQRYDKMINTLESYCMLNPVHTNGYVYLYDALKQYYPKDRKRLRNLLKQLSYVDPSNEKLLDLPDLWIYSDNVLVIETMFNMLDYPKWMNNNSIWSLSASTLFLMHRNPLKSEFEKLGNLWKERVYWWPLYHFQENNIVVNTDDDAELVMYKALTFCALAGTDNLYVKAVKKILSSKYDQYLKTLKTQILVLESLEASDDDDDDTDDFIVSDNESVEESAKKKQNNDSVTLSSVKSIKPTSKTKTSNNSKKKSKSKRSSDKSKTKRSSDKSKTKRSSDKSKTKRSSDNSQSISKEVIDSSVDNSAELSTHPRNGTEVSSPVTNVNSSCKSRSNLPTLNITSTHKSIDLPTTIISTSSSSPGIITSTYVKSKASSPTINTSTFVTSKLSPRIDTSTFVTSPRINMSTFITSRDNSFSFDKTTEPSRRNNTTPFVKSNEPFQELNNYLSPLQKLSPVVKRLFQSSESDIMEDIHDVVDNCIDSLKSPVKTPRKNGYSDPLSGNKKKSDKRVKRKEREKSKEDENDGSVVSEFSQLSSKSKKSRKCENGGIDVDGFISTRNNTEDDYNYSICDPFADDESNNYSQWPNSNTVKSCPNIGKIKKSKKNSNSIEQSENTFELKSPTVLSVNDDFSGSQNRSKKSKKKRKERENSVDEDISTLSNDNQFNNSRSKFTPDNSNLEETRPKQNGDSKNKKSKKSNSKLKEYSVIDGRVQTWKGREDDCNYSLSDLVGYDKDYSELFCGIGNYNHDANVEEVTQNVDKVSRVKKSKNLPNSNEETQVIDDSDSLSTVVDKEKSSKKEKRKNKQKNPDNDISVIEVISNGGRSKKSKKSANDGEKISTDIDGHDENFSFAGSVRKKKKKKHKEKSQNDDDGSIVSNLNLSNSNGKETTPSVKTSKKSNKSSNFTEEVDNSIQILSIPDTSRIPIVTITDSQSTTKNDKKRKKRHKEINVENSSSIINQLGLSPIPLCEETSNIETTKRRKKSKKSAHFEDEKTTEEYLQDDWKMAEFTNGTPHARKKRNISSQDDNELIEGSEVSNSQYNRRKGTYDDVDDRSLFITQNKFRKVVLNSERDLFDDDIWSICGEK